MEKALLAIRLPAPKHQPIAVTGRWIGDDNRFSGCTLFITFKSALYFDIDRATHKFT